MATQDNVQSGGSAPQPKPSHRGGSPPAQSKRDKRRQQLSDRLSVLAEQFSRDRDRLYREELQKIQIDVSLISRVNPYENSPLDAIEREYREMSQTANSNGSGGRSMLEMAGPKFEEWVQTVEDLVEHRDFELTSQKSEFDRKMRNHINTHAYKVEVAKREHKAMSSTLRDRLMNNITARKTRLGKEKEQLEIADSSALLLHPSQFSFTHPASPGGNSGKRATRLRREMEELPGFSGDKKRKRNVADDDGSPAPTRRAFDKSDITPLWQNDRIRSMRREGSLAYSIDKLFTDKELSMTYNTAALAAHKHLLTRRDASGNVIPSPDESEAGNGEADEGDKEEEASAPSMERVPSHATRSTRGGHSNTNWYDDKLLGIEGLTNFEVAGNLDKMAAQEPKLPPLHSQHYSKNQYVKAESNTPTSLSTEDAAHDLMVMNVFKQYQKVNGQGSNLAVENGGRKLLEVMAPPQTANRYKGFVQVARPNVQDLSEDLGVQFSSLRDEATPSQGHPAGGVGALAAAAAAEPMSRQSSAAGAAMSRTGSSRGKRKP